MPDLSQDISFLLILQGKHVKDVHMGRREGENVGDDWQITFPVSFFSLSFQSIPSPKML